MKSTLPKLLHRVCGKEMVSLAVEAVKRAGAQKTFVVVPPDSAAIRHSLGSGVQYVEQDKPLGTGHALLQATSLLTDVENVLVTYGDVPLIRPETLARMMSLHSESSSMLTLLTASGFPTNGMGRVVRDSSGKITAVVEEKDADPHTRSISEVNSGIYCMSSPWLRENLPTLSISDSGETYLTDLVSIAAHNGSRVDGTHPDDEWEILGINDRVQLAQAESVMRQRIRQRWMRCGVTLIEPESTYIDATAELGQDTVVHPNTHILGDTKIGKDCAVGPNSIVSDSTTGDRCRIVSSVLEGSRLGAGVSVGPFSHIRGSSQIEDDVHVGNFAEIKSSHLGRGTKMGHFSYIGNAVLGANVNIGAGTVTCNFDGQRKHRTLIGDNAFIGSDSMLVAPVTIGEGASTAAGAVVTKDVPPNFTAIGVPAKNSPKPKQSD